MRVFAGRPATIKQGEWTIYVCVMDAGYKATQRAYKRLLRDNHPDKGGSSTKFRKVVRARERWEQEEVKRYATIGLEPPDYRHKGEQECHYNWNRPRLNERP